MGWSSEMEGENIEVGEIQGAAKTKSNLWDNIETIKSKSSKIVTCMKAI